MSSYVKRGKVDRGVGSGLVTVERGSDKIGSCTERFGRNGKDSVKVSRLIETFCI